MQNFSDYDNDERLKQEIIKTLMQTKYKNNINDRNKIEADLQFMNNIQLDIMLNVYYLYEIKEKI